MEFLVLLIVTLLISIAVAFIVIYFFRKPTDAIFARIIGEDISKAWRKFLTFALFVIGVSNGGSIRKLGRFIDPVEEGAVPPELSPQFWGLEIYRTIISTLGGMAWALLIFFIVALVAFVIVKRGESKKQNLSGN